MANGYLFYVNNIVSVFTFKDFKGWGRKRSGRFALWCHQAFGGRLTLLEDGFVCHAGLNGDDSFPFSYVEDDIGIYYDATRPSKLENILSTYDFSSNNELMEMASEAIRLVKKYHISKYNDSFELDENFKNKYSLTDEYGHIEKILVVAQTFGDMSLKYGLTETFSTEAMIQAALDENPDATIYLKVHPDVIHGKKRSDIDIEQAKQTCIVIEDTINPISLIIHFKKIYTKTSQMGFEALLFEKECICFGLPFYAGWGVTDDRVRCERRERVLTAKEIFAAAYILYTQYRNPYTGRPSDIISTIKEIQNFKKIQRPQENAKAYFFGFSRWKHRFVRPFFSELKDKNIIFINPIVNKSHLYIAFKKGLNKHSRIYIWGRKTFVDVEQYAKEENIEIFRVEDGFIRSVGLGSDLTQPYSQVVDSRGIYFDPSRESDLEHILNYYDFSEDVSLIVRAEKIRKYLIEKKLSKYNVYDERMLQFPKEKRVILIPGQVEDDASMLYGAKGMSNLGLVKKVRTKCPNDYIVYKPHPDVLVGNRAGYIDECEVLKYCDEIVTDVALYSVLMCVNEVHTMTSLVGFEALLRGLDVHTYGMPFYAGWGLSKDEQKCTRRRRELKLDELVAGALVLYPRYIDPHSKKPCTIEIFLEALKNEREFHFKSKSLRRWKSTRNFVSRKLQVLLSYAKSI